MNCFQFRQVINLRFSVCCLTLNKIVEYITLFRLQKGSDSKLELHLLVGFLTVSKLNISLKKGSEYDLFRFK